MLINLKSLPINPKTSRENVKSRSHTPQNTRVFVLPRPGYLGVKTRVFTLRQPGFFTHSPTDFSNLPPVFFIFIIDVFLFSRVSLRNTIDIFYNTLYIYIPNIFFCLFSYIIIQFCFDF